MKATKSTFKANCYVTIAVLFASFTLKSFTYDKLCFSSDRLYSVQQLNQLELFKQFIGVWVSQKSKDTTYILEFKLFGDTLKSKIKYESKGKIFSEHNGSFGFDSERDKMIGFMEESNRPIAMYFSSRHICESGPIAENNNQTRIMVFRKCEFKSQDSFAMSLLVKDKFINDLTYSRIKK
jgi:hypothetical protein